MKFLHLSDLHIGKNVNGFSMLEEQRHIFRQIIGLIQTESPNAVVIAGDVYDRAVPGIEAVRVLDDFLTELADLDVAVLLISGNHDSPERLDFASRLLAEKRLFLCGTFDTRMSKVTLTDDCGEIDFWLLPFIKPSLVRGMFEDRELESYEDALRAALDTAAIDLQKRNVLVSHQFFTKSGVDLFRCESELNPVGGLDAIDVGIVEAFDYVALGHLHRAQSVGTERVRYAGSPVKYSFSECRHQKSVTLVELCEKGSLTITELPLTPIHDMREIKGQLETLISDEVSALADKEDYLRVVLTDEGEIIDPMGKIRSVYPNVMAITFENTRSSIEVANIAPDPDKTTPLSPYELFHEFFLEVNGSTMSEEQAAIVQELMETEIVQ